MIAVFMRTHPRWPTAKYFKLKVISDQPFHQADAEDHCRRASHPCAFAPSGVRNLSFLLNLLGHAAQFEALELAGLGPRQRVHESDGAGILVRGNLRLHMVLQ